MASGLAPARRKDYDPNRLTPHELAVANLVGQGMSNRQIAADIMVSIKTVQAHLTKIYAKMGVASRAELAARIHQDAPPPDRPRTPLTSAYPNRGVWPTRTAELIFCTFSP